MYFDLVYFIGSQMYLCAKEACSVSEMLTMLGVLRDLVH